MICNLCKKTKVKNLKGNNIKGNINRFCLKCQNENKQYIKNLLEIENDKRFNKVMQEQKTQNDLKQQSNENKQILFNCWVIQERQDYKKFLTQQKNKDFLFNQYLKDIEQDLKEE